MIAITEGFTSISAGTDTIAPPGSSVMGAWPGRRPRRIATGVRVTLEFCRATPLLTGQPVSVRYDIAGDGRLREGAGIALPTRTDVRWGHSAVYHYRLSYWIAADAVMQFVAPTARHRTDERDDPPRKPAGQASTNG
jgi:hypothetical protein